MDAGKLDTRVLILRKAKVSDGFGGTTSTESTALTIWAKKKDKRGEVKSVNSQRKLYTEIELVVRKKTADNLNYTDVIQIENESDKYRINEFFDSQEKYFTTIKATRIG
jgi:head-tail adaptor